MVKPPAAEASRVPWLALVPTLMVVLARDAPEPSARVPADTVVVPVKVFAALSVEMPAPVFVSPPAPEIVPPYWLLPEALSSVRILPLLMAMAAAAPPRIVTFSETVALPTPKAAFTVPPLSE